MYDYKQLNPITELQKVPHQAERIKVKCPFQHPNRPVKNYFMVEKS